MVSCGRFGFTVVATGEVDAAIAQSMEALLQPGVEMVGLLSAGLQSTKDFASAGRRDGESQGTPMPRVLRESATSAPAPHCHGTRPERCRFRRR
jgi:hypothetical protein